MEKKYVLGIAGSPRKKGNTSCLIEGVFKALPEDEYDTQLIHLNDYKFSPCIGCEKCSKDHHCHIKDEMQEIYPLVEKADALILASPTYTYNISAWMKAFIDRLYCYYNFDKEDRSKWSPIIGRNRPAIVIGVGEQHKIEYLGFTIEAMKKPLIDLGFNVVDELPVLGHFSKGSVKGDQEVMGKAFAMGEKLKGLL